MTESLGQESARGRHDELPNIHMALSKRRGMGCFEGLDGRPWVSATAGRLRGAGEPLSCGQQELFCVSACGDFERWQQNHV